MHEEKFKEWWDKFCEGTMPTRYPDENSSFYKAAKDAWSDGYQVAEAISKYHYRELELSYMGMEEDWNELERRLIPVMDLLKPKV
jgi:hypothetical protein